MSKSVTIRITQSTPNTGNFNIFDEFGNIIEENVTKSSLIQGKTYSLNNDVKFIVLKSIGRCYIEKTIPIETISLSDYVNTTYTQVATTCLWRHLTNIRLYNNFYGEIHPYIIEYPFSYKFNDEILQSVKDYTRSYTYLPIKDGVFNDNSSIEINRFFNKAILYNGQQCSGLLNLDPKPINNLKEYLSYPKYNSDSKTIIYTKSDNFYQYNTFWSLVKDVKQPLFLTSCKSLSIDKELNQNNMDYGKRSFKKETLRAKWLKVRHILDDVDDLHLVSGFITTNSQISYK